MSSASKSKQRSAKMVFEKTIQSAIYKSAKMTKRANPVIPFFAEFCPVTGIFYSIFRCPLKLSYTKNENKMTKVERGYYNILRVTNNPPFLVQNNRTTNHMQVFCSLYVFVIFEGKPNLHCWAEITGQHKQTFNIKYVLSKLALLDPLHCTFFVQGNGNLYIGCTLLVPPPPHPDIGWILSSKNEA